MKNRTLAGTTLTYFKQCAEGKRCLLDRDCPANVRCFNPNGSGGQCLAQGTKFMHVIGLGASTYTYLNGSVIDGQSVDFGTIAWNAQTDSGMRASPVPRFFPTTPIY